jgi:hypothetical protein
LTRIMAGLVPIGAALLGLIPGTLNISTRIFDKIGFDLDVIGRQREILRLEEGLRLNYTRPDARMNIAVWNMHVPMDYHFDDLQLVAHTVMGKGGGFEVRVFSGGGYLKNNGRGGNDNWKWSGISHEEGNVVYFEPIPWAELAKLADEKKSIDGI